MWMTKKKQKGRNITVYVPEDTGRKMDELTEVNWSQICKAAIEYYVEARKSMSPAARLKLEEMRKYEEKDGYIFGSQLVSEILDKLSYQEVHDLRWKYLDEAEEDWWYDEPSFITDWLSDEVHGERRTRTEDHTDWQENFDEWASEKGSLGWVLKLAEKKGFRKNPAFFQGMIKALRENLA